MAQSPEAVMSAVLAMPGDTGPVVREGTAEVGSNESDWAG